MKFSSLPLKISLDIQMSINDSTENDCFPVEVERVGNDLVVSCTHAGSDEVVEKFNLRFNHTTESFEVVK
jgi:hypothetical protein